MKKKQEFFFRGQLYKIQLDFWISVVPPVHHWFCAQLHLGHGRK